MPQAYAHPDTKPFGSEIKHMFIQWKGTEICMDFTCACGADYHIDEQFAYKLHCLACDTIWELGTQVIVKRVVDPKPDIYCIKLQPT